MKPQEEYLCDNCNRYGCQGCLTKDELRRFNKRMVEEAQRKIMAEIVSDDLRHEGNNQRRESDD